MLKDLGDAHPGACCHHSTGLTQEVPWGGSFVYMHLPSDRSLRFGLRSAPRYHSPLTGQSRSRGEPAHERGEDQGGPNSQFCKRFLQTRPPASSTWRRFGRWRSRCSIRSRAPSDGSATGSHIFTAARVSVPLIRNSLLSPHHHCDAGEGPSSLSRSAGAVRERQSRDRR